MFRKRIGIDGNTGTNPARKNRQIGRERHWEPRRVFFPRRCEEFRKRQTKESNMSLIKKAPGIVTLEVKIEEPVKELLEDYAEFIDSTPDHVVSVVLKKTLWRDRDYRKWREERRGRAADAPRPCAQARG
jgi:hypothetical protein